MASRKRPPKPTIPEELQSLRGRLRMLYQETGHEPDEHMIERTIRDGIEACLQPYAEKELVRIFGLDGVLEDEDPSAD